MPSFRRFSIFIVIMALFLTGCYNRPVRNLASDVSLIKIGQSTREDVLVYLGEPDVQRMVSANLEEWIYVEEKDSDFQKWLLVGRAFSSDGYAKIIVTLEKDQVIDCRYSAYEKGEFDWSDDYSWQKKKQ